jgi:peptidoglycan/LPS O-acetylase OafA/YrhL
VDTSPPPHRDLALDGLRGLAVLLVLLLHFQLPPGPTWADHWVHIAQFVGYSGVDLFFVLSGFLITGVLLDAKGAPRYFRTFYARRALRVLPLYYGTLIVLLWLAPLASPDTAVMAAALRSRQWWYWLHATNILGAMHVRWSAPFYTAHFWSLAIEEQFYLLWPVIVLLTTRRRLLDVCAWGCVLALALRLALALSGAGEKWIYQLTPARVDTLLIGAALAVWARDPQGLERLVRPARAVFPAAVSAYLALMIADVRWPTSHVAYVAFHTLGYTACAVTYGALLVLVTASPLRTTAEAPLLRTFGRYGYGIYLVNPFVFVLLAPVFDTAYTFPRPGGTLLLAQLWVFATGVTVSTLIAAASWHLYEQPFLRLKRYVPLRADGATSGGSAAAPNCAVNVSCASASIAVIAAEPRATSAGVSADWPANANNVRVSRSAVGSPATRSRRTSA